MVRCNVTFGRKGKSKQFAQDLLGEMHQVKVKFLFYRRDWRVSYPKSKTGAEFVQIHVTDSMSKC